jgi:hypothetical protein
MSFDSYYCLGERIYTKRSEYGNGEGFDYYQSGRIRVNLPQGGHSLWHVYASSYQKLREGGCFSRQVSGHDRPPNSLKARWRPVWFLYQPALGRSRLTFRWRPHLFTVSVHSIIQWSWYRWYRAYVSGARERSFMIGNGGKPEWRKHIFRPLIRKLPIAHRNQHHGSRREWCTPRAV